MQRAPRQAPTGSLPAFITLLCFTALASAGRAEQTHVTRFDVFAGYSQLRSPKVSLVEQGMHLQIGVRPSKWYSIGFDYTNVSGDLTLTPNLLPNELQDRLRQQLGQLAAIAVLRPDPDMH